jgi:G3E family GTPase
LVDALVLPTITMVHGDVSPSLLYGPLKPNIKSCRLTGEQRESKEAGHLHVSHKHDRLSSVKIEFDEPLVRDRFLERIDKLPTQVFRIKGVIEFRGERGLKLFQSVAGRHDISEYKNPDFEERFLVCIGKNMESYISALRAFVPCWKEEPCKKKVTRAALCDIWAKARMV